MKFLQFTEIIISDLYVYYKVLTTTLSQYKLHNRKLYMTLTSLPRDTHYLEFVPFFLQDLEMLSTAADECLFAVIFLQPTVFG